MLDVYYRLVPFIQCPFTHFGSKLHVYISPRKTSSSDAGTYLHGHSVNNNTHLSVATHAYHLASDHDIHRPFQTTSI